VGQHWSNIGKQWATTYRQGDNIGKQESNTESGESTLVKDLKGVDQRIDGFGY